MTFSAAWDSRILPTWVEPVKETFRTRGVRHDSRDHVTGVAGDDNVNDAGRDAGLLQDLGQEQGCQRGLHGGFEDGRAPCREGGCDLPGTHCEREVPGRDQQGGPHGTLGDGDPVIPAGLDAVLALGVKPAGGFGEPAEEPGAVIDFSLSF